MYRKKFMFFVVFVLLLTGCTKVTSNLDEAVGAALTNNKLPANTVSTSYELYIPTGVNQVVDSQYNQKFKIKDRYVYLYVDTVSYYYKNTLNYKSDDEFSYYYKEISLGDKTGYIGINKIEEDLYFCKIFYNYSKVEFYSNKDDLPVILVNALIMQKSIKYNDSLISMELESNISDGRELKYELDSPKDSKSTFSDYLQEYVAEEEPEVELPDDVNG